MRFSVEGPAFDDTERRDDEKRQRALLALTAPSPLRSYGPCIVLAIRLPAENNVRLRHVRLYTSP